MRQRSLENTHDQQKHYDALCTLLEETQGNRERKSWRRQKMHRAVRMSNGTCS